ncbi:sensor histidine kinase [Chitinophaga nivalis]|uniref:Histidine kinase n=1 Tax=Chitinophaga nivalis TaxID=2991709 RepID=A0ABT3IGW3_9BACT|nr:histidine kinase [Chitinophaga nivalis]MCW3467126.1 histidine kinase [Chitinophaga nivalis]MCW3483183.1 histidine kinase [Chitinophaga nivalis]
MAFISLWRKYKFVCLHVVAWVVYMAIGTLNKVSAGKQSIHLLDILLTQLPGIYVFYGNSFLFFKLLSPRKFVWLLIGEVLFFLSYLLFFYFIGDVLSPLLAPSVAIPPLVLKSFVISGFWIFMIYSFFGFGYYFARRSFLNEKEIGRIQLDKLAAEQGKLEAEYAFLRAQINPHFLHNTLNFFYAKSLGYSKELSEGILTLCEIMRYSLSSGEDESGTVLLGKEVEHLHHVIKINQLRFSNRLQVDFEITGDVWAVRIIPLVLITLVENAFKHGELTRKEHPLVFRLEVTEDNNSLCFSIQNKKKNGPKELSHGIGMSNIRQRLSATYKDRYRLNIKDEEEYYAVSLVINYEKNEMEHPPAPDPGVGKSNAGEPTGRISYNQNIN